MRTKEFVKKHSEHDIVVKMVVELKIDFNYYT